MSEVPLYTGFRPHASPCPPPPPPGAAAGHYRGTSLIRKRPPVGPCSRTMPRAVWWPQGAPVSHELGTPVHQNKRVVLKARMGGAGARAVHPIITMIKWIWTSRLSIKNSLSLQAEASDSRSADGWEVRAPALSFTLTHRHTLSHEHTHSLSLSHTHTETLTRAALSLSLSHTHQVRTADGWDWDLDQQYQSEMAPMPSQWLQRVPSLQSVDGRGGAPLMAGGARGGQGTER